MPSLALLVFTRNDGERAARMIRDSSGLFDDVVLIDSSDPAEYARLKETLPPERATIHRVLPVGDVDLLRPYGVHHVRTDRVLIVDSDETLSTGLRAALPTLTDVDAYVVPRHETGLGAYTYHLRLYRPGSVRFGPRSWEYPIVEGSTATLPYHQCLEHSADFAHYLDREERARRCLLAESYERPFTREYATRLFPPLRYVAGRGRWDLSLAEPAVRAVLGLEFARELLLTGNLNLARFHLGYSRAKARYLDRLSPDERARRLEIHRQSRAAGGLIRYLGFDDPAYVDRLSGSFPWNLDGPQVLEALVDYRFRSGHPRESWTPSDPPA